MMLCCRSAIFIFKVRRGPSLIFGMGINVGVLVDGLAVDRTGAVV